jgi:hypothetical protein
VSEVLEKFCRIKEGADSILFGVEKGGTLKLVATGAEKLTEESRILVGGAGQPPKLKKHMVTICEAFHSAKHRELLPRSIRGLWRTDLFVGSTVPDRWVATTLKTNADQLEADAGIRLGIYPERRAGELPAWDERRNLILCPLQYNGAFVELFYASFAIVKQCCSKTPRSRRRGCCTRPRIASLRRSWSTAANTASEQSSRPSPDWRIPNFSRRASLAIRRTKRPRW